MNDQELAHKVCTPREYDIWRLHQAGMTTRTISLALNLSRWTVRDHIANAQRKITAAQTKETTP